MPGENDELQTLRRQEYQLRLDVERLRREVYAQPIPSASPELLKELAEAEKALAEVEANRASVEKADPNSGLIWHATGWGAAGAPSGLLGATTTGLEVEVRLCMEHVPTSLCHLFTRDEHPLVSCTARNHDTDKERRVRVIAEVEGYSARAVDSVELAKRGTTDGEGRERDRHTFALLPTFFPGQLNSVTELTRATVNVMVEDLDGEIEQHKTVPIWLLARSTAPTAVKDPTTGEMRDMSRYLGAFVTPNAPSLMKYLRTAARYHPDGRLRGYQKGTADVESQVKAIYDALKHDADITYVNSMIDFSPDLGTRSQRVRLPRESLDHKEANCIDGTVLFASLLEGISLSAALVVLPGHALVAWQEDPNKDEWTYLETTMIGTDAFQESKTEGKSKAEFYEEMAKGTGNPNFFRRWPLGELRTDHGITPME
jgi:hypothetical protein